ncbi:hypothetical protein BAUCODRAFT_144818 [Baudoinia panamericana UAMH 10762]|uniref:Uncharacterized protein n=1 Tax=Baudoinia panamericana (strain UAMH 10762) TaxID=717646 RepID=M2NQE9_BAUPA|nr:uncharacterized protein BAUCODRAFT_144818 [Baudoinia panamericana UAMH 10762]EMD01276.1 hypothetical protein BAUCODRAFT_144818 [Baudoinia panamericana UAMH 10762]
MAMTNPLKDLKDLSFRNSKGHRGKPSRLLASFGTLRPRREIPRQQLPGPGHCAITACMQQQLLGREGEGSNRYFPSVATIDYAYGNTPSGSALRRLLLDAFIFVVHPPWVDEDLHHLNHEFLRDLATGWYENGPTLSLGSAWIPKATR